MSPVETIYIFAIALTCSALTIPFLIRFAACYGLFDYPDHEHIEQKPIAELGKKLRRRIHSVPTPRLGGIAIVLSFFLAQACASVVYGIKGIFLFSLVTFLLGLVDDLKPLSALLRLFIQSLNAFLVVYFYDLGIKNFALTTTLWFPIPEWLGVFLAVFVIVGAINSINMIDGLDGLASGIVLIGVVLLSYLYFLRSKDLALLIYFSLPLIGAVLGFLKYNTHPATIFMGDSGSNWLGFIVGLLMLFVLNQLAITPDAHGTLGITSINSPHHVPFLSAILCLSLPVFDTAHVMISRIKNGLSPMTPDKRHFHHALMKIGLSHTQSVTTLYFVALFVGVVGAMPVAFHRNEFWWTPYLAAIGLMVLIPMGFSARLYDLLKHRKLNLAKGSMNPLSKFMRFWETSNRYILYLILLMAPAFAGVIPEKIGYAALVSFGLVAISFFWNFGRMDFMESFLLSVAAGVLLVASNQNAMAVEILGIRHNIQYVYNAIFVWLFISTFLFMLLTFKKRDFLFTASDFLLVLIPLCILLVPEPYNLELRLNIIALRSMVLFLVIRSMVKRHRYVVFRLRLFMLASLMYVAMAGIAGFRIVY